MTRAIMALLLTSCMTATAAEPLLGRIVYRADRWHGNAVYTVDATGRNDAHLVNAGDIGRPLWSPLGDRVAVGDRVFDPDGIVGKLVSPDGEIADWSRDGAWLAVVEMGRNGRCAVSKVRPDRSDFQRLTAFEFDPHMLMVEWSPGATRLLVTGERLGARRAMYLLRASGGELDRIPDTDVGRGGHWSADAKSIYYVTGLTTLGVLRRLDLADRSIHELQERWRLRRLLAVSPDGRYLLGEQIPAFDGAPYMGIFDLNGELVTPLAHKHGWPVAADWFMSRSQLAVSPAGKQAVVWAELRAGE